MSEETNATNAESMSSAEFEARLTEFLSQHKESKLRLVPRILEEFKGQESIVLEHLHNKYVLGIVAEKPKKKHSKKAEDHAEGTATAGAAQAPPKSKKTLIIIIVIAVVVIGLGVTAFLMKDKFMGKKEEPAKTETAPAQTPAPAEQPKEEAAPVASTQTDTAAASGTDTSAAKTDSVPVQ